MATQDLTLDLDAGVLHRHAQFQSWRTGQPTTCDNCAGDLHRTAYITGILYQESVNVCSGRCFNELHQVWAPTTRTIRYKKLCWSLAASVLLWLGR